MGLVEQISGSPGRCRMALLLSYLPAYGSGTYPGLLAGLPYFLSVVNFVICTHDAHPFALQMRSYAAVIFRRIASKTRKTANSETTDMFISLSAEQAIVIRGRLLETLAAETDKAIRNKISDAVAEIARQYSDNGV